MAAGRLERIKIEGFRSIRALDLELGPINILIGANGSGKSNFLSFFDFYQQLKNKNLAFYVSQQGGASKILHFGNKQTKRLTFEFAFAGEHLGIGLAPTVNDAFVFEYEERRKGEDVEYTFEMEKPKNEAGFPSHRQTSNWLRYHFHDTSESASIKKAARVDQTQMLMRDGENLAPFLHHIRSEAPSNYHRIVATVQRVAPFLLDFVLEPEGKEGSFMRLRWRHRASETIFDANDFSDGTLRFICLVTLFLQPNMPTLILLDEPELGLHPFALAILAGLIRSVSDTTQVIASTQSVTFANQFAAEDIIVVDQIDNAREFSRLDLERLKVWLDDYGVGDLWEKNLLGGTP